MLSKTVVPALLLLLPTGTLARGMGGLLGPPPKFGHMAARVLCVISIETVPTFNASCALAIEPW